MKIDISIVIVNYNVRAFLEQCLMAIDRATHSLGIERFVVDNASVDGSQTMVKKKFPHVHLIENRINVGFSRANNQALRKAKGTYVLILNPDTLIQEDTLLILKNYLDLHTDVGAVGCRLINPDGSFQITSRRSLPTPWVAFTRIVGLSKIFPKSRVFGRYNMTYVNPGIETEVDVLPGSLMFIRRDIMAAIDYFDENFFMYGEDVDLCYRIKNAGWKIVYLPETKAIHYKGESTKKSEFSFVSNFYTAMLIFANKHYKHRYSIFMRMLLVAGIYGRALFSYTGRILKNFISTSIDLLFIIMSIFLAIKIWLPYSWLARFGFILPIFTAVWVVSLYLFGAYHKKGRFHIRPVLWSSIVGLLINSTFVYFFKQYAYSRVVVLISFVLILVSLSLWRTIYRLVGPVAKKGPISKLRRAIIIGAGKEGKRILAQLQNRPDMLYEICGFVDFDQKTIGKAINGAEVLATIDSIRDVIRIERINDVIFSSDRLSNAQILETIILAQGTGVNFRIVPHELEYIVAKSSVDEIDTVPMLDFSGIADPLDLIIKRLFDIFAAALIIIVTTPFVLLNMLVGGRLMKWTVAGYMGKPISIYEFKGGIGFLKKIPLFYTVFTGTLSIVGSEISEYDPKACHTIYKPGITGLVQIKAREKKTALTQKEKDYYNLYYVKNQSVITDIQILLKSIF